MPGSRTYKRWKPEGQQKFLTRLQEARNNAWTPFYCLNVRCNGQPHCWPIDDRKCAAPEPDDKGHIRLGRFGHIWRNEDDHGSLVDWYCDICGVGGILLDEWGFPHSRRDQRPPRWKTHDWLTLFLRGGRGSGKTRTGSEITNRASDLTSHIILIGATGPDLRETMVEGPSGVLVTAKPGQRPTWEPSRKRLVWPNGCIGRGFSAEEPDRLRGPQSGFVWADEPSHWPLVDNAWENMLYGLRMGRWPKIIATSTPKPNQWTRDKVEEDDTVDRIVSSLANESNLSPAYKKKIIAPFIGTRRGRQEIEGELLEDVEGALWAYAMIQSVPEPPDLRRIVVAVDPAGTANKRSDETGIIVLGISHNDVLYVLEDLTAKYTPAGWGSMVAKAHRKWEADAVVAEKNYGEDMVTYVLENEAEKANELLRVIGVQSRRGKDIRAEPIVALYEHDLVKHVHGENRDDAAALSKLEDEMTSWVPHQGPSPNRVDALVHGATDLARHKFIADIASPNDLLRSRTTSSGNVLARVS